MNTLATSRRPLVLSITFVLAATITGCGSKEPPAATTAAPPAPVATDQAAPAVPAPQPTAFEAPAPASWSPEALEDLLAPVALYPDPVLSQVLIASTNPQEVLDAGNWLLENQGLSGKALDDAAASVGFTPPIRALVQFPDTVDMMCRELGWTTELGQAFVADQAGVLDAVQRLRKQAMDVGNLQSSPQMTVETQQQADKEVIVLEPPPSNSVSVPQYDPVAVYAPPPAAATTATAATPTTATTTTTTEKSGHSTGALITTGLLSFGAGILVNELFDDDDDWDDHNYWYPNYGYGGMPYYPPYPYRPAYGGGFYPGTGYRPPPGYGGGFYNSGNIVINTGGGRNDYWDRYDNNRPGRVDAQPRSPISAAKPNRPELADLNKRQPRPMPADVKRPAKGAEPANWKGKQSYAGAGGTYQGAKDKAAARPSAGVQTRPAPKVQGSYKGGTVDRSKVPQSGYAGAARDKAGAQRPTAQPAARPTQKPAARPAGPGDRGYTRPESAPRPKPAAKPEAKPAQKPATRTAPAAGQGRPQKGSAVSGANRSGKADRAASQRGKQSMPQGAKSKGGGGKKKR